MINIIDHMLSRLENKKDVKINYDNLYYAKKAREELMIMGITNIPKDIV
jgi:hypothetical protein